MPAYLVVIRRRVLDAERYADYLVAANETLAFFGAKILAAGGTTEWWEGPPVDGSVVVEFRDIGHARTWFHSDRYARARALRRGAAELEILVTESVKHPAAPGGYAGDSV